jgi:hypothetical protein
MINPPRTGFISWFPRILNLGMPSKKKGLLFPSSTLDLTGVRRLVLHASLESTLTDCCKHTGVGRPCQEEFLENRHFFMFFLGFYPTPFYGIPDCSRGLLEQEFTIAVGSAASV